MPWFKVDDKLHDHRKVRSAGTAAMGLWVLAGAWSMDNLEEGFVPESVCQRWDRNYRKLAEKLVTAGLWMEAMRDGERGWRFHDWADQQRSKSEIERDRAAAAERQRRAREAARSRRDADLQSRRDTTVSHGPPDQTRPDQTQEQNPSDSVAPAPKQPDRFDEFWGIYPRREAKDAARKAWAKATKTTDADVVLAGAARYRDDPNREAEFTAHPSTWLNQGRWADDPLPARQRAPQARQSAVQPDWDALRGVS